MEPSIQYAKTKDGVSIAYWTMGEGGGTPLLMTAPNQWSHISLELGIPALRAWYEHLAKDRMIVRYDFRGQGLSERDIGDLRVEHFETDISAVIDRLALEEVSLAGLFAPGYAAAMFAASHPSKVSKLVLWGLVTRPKDIFASPQGQALLALLDKDWETYTETLAHQILGWRPGRRAHEWAAFIRQSTSQLNEQKVMALASQFELDRTLLARIAAETLILASAESPVPTRVETSVRDLASDIANSHTVVLSEGLGAPWNIDSGTAAMDDFLSDGATHPATHPEGMTAILFLDIAGVTALTTKLGDAAYREKERVLDSSLRAAITEAGGAPVEGKVLGDGVMAVFTSARQAIDAALRCRDIGNDAGLPLHLGVHAGDVVREGNNVHGGAVQMASRVQGAAAPGEILVSDIVRGLARTSAGVEFEDRGEHELKGIAESQRLFAVRKQS